MAAALSGELSIEVINSGDDHSLCETCKSWCSPSKMISKYGAYLNNIYQTTKSYTIVVCVNHILLWNLPIYKEKTYKIFVHAVDPFLHRNLRPILFFFYLDRWRDGSFTPVRSLPLVSHWNIALCAFGQYVCTGKLGVMNWSKGLLSIGFEVLFWSYFLLLRW